MKKSKFKRNEKQIPIWIEPGSGKLVQGLTKDDFTGKAKPEDQKQALSQHFRYMGECDLALSKKLQKKATEAEKRAQGRFREADLILSKPNSRDRLIAQKEKLLKQLEGIDGKLGIEPEKEEEPADGKE